MKQSFCLIALIACLSSFAQASSAWAGSPHLSSDHSESAGLALAKEILHHIALVSQRNNHFTETRTLHALKQPVFSKGELKFSPPDHIEKQTLLPVKESIIIEGDTMQFKHGESPAKNISLHLDPALQIIADTIRGPLEGNIPLLQHYYTLNADGNYGQWCITLTPRTKDVAQIIQIVRLEGHNNVIEHIYLRQTNGDITDTFITPK